MRRRERLANAILLLLPACSIAPNPARSVDPAIAIVDIRRDGPNNCRVDLGGRSFAIPGQGDQLVEAIRKLRNRVDRLHIVGGTDVPYRCMGGVIFEAQRANIPVGFTAEPPP